MKKLILVDDERVNGELLKLSLEMDGYHVTLCPGLSRARLVLNAAVDALIIDYHLGQGEIGTELVREIRQGETAAPADTFIIITSGDDRQEGEAVESGANYFLLKPFSPAQLTEYIEHHWAGKAVA
jgi:CheY-like chemotaxis protein